MTDPVPKFTPVAFQHWKESDSQECWAMCVADCDGDGTPEIILTGHADVPGPPGLPFSMGEVRVVRFQPPDQLVQVGHTDWPGDGATTGHAVCAADVDLDGTTEIVVAGSTYDGSIATSPTRAHLRIMTFDGQAFAVKDTLTWLPDETAIRRFLKAPCHVIGALLNSVTVADIDGDGHPEIVCGGTVAISTGNPAQTHNLGWIEVFDWTRPASTRRTSKYRHCFWPGMHDTAGIPISDNNITDIACADIDADGDVEIVSIGNSQRAGELRAWGIRTGDSGPEFFLKAEKDWDWANWYSHPHFLRLRIDDLLGERGGLDIITGGGIYMKIRTRTPPRPAHTEPFVADMRIWRPDGAQFRETEGMPLILSTAPDSSFRIYSSRGSLYFKNSACRAVYSADVDNDGRTEMLSLHEIRGPIGGSPMCGLIVAWDPTGPWGWPRGEIWKREFTYGILNQADQEIETKTSGIWAGDIDGDGRTETVISGFYADGLKRGIYVGLLR